MTDSVLKAAVPVLPVADVKSSARFYGNRLGFITAHIDDGYAVLQRAGVEIHLWQASDESWKNRTGPPIETGAESFLAGTASCRVLVSGIEALYDEMMTSKVVHPNGPLTDKPYGLREFAVLDGDGNLVTFFSPIEPDTGS